MRQVHEASLANRASCVWCPQQSFFGKITVIVRDPLTELAKPRVSQQHSFELAGNQGHTFPSQSFRGLGALCMQWPGYVSLHCLRPVPHLSLHPYNFCWRSEWMSEWINEWLNSKRGNILLPPVCNLSSCSSPTRLALAGALPASAPCCPWEHCGLGHGWLLAFLSLLYSQSVPGHLPVGNCFLSYHLESSLMDDFTLMCWCLPGAEVVMCILKRTSKEIDF